jgi:taurine dioxygenase
MTALERSPPFALDLDIHPLAGRIGAEIGNVRLTGDLPEPAIAAIEAALAKYKVIFFRNQNHLDDGEQERFAARLGDIVAHPTTPGARRYCYSGA